MIETNRPPGWQDYFSALLDLQPAGGVAPLTIDLSEQVPLSARTILPPCGAVITAFNPKGATVEQTQNLSRAAELESWLDSRGCPWFRADGLSRDRSHCERGVFAELPKQRAVEAGLEFEQSAIYWWDGSAFWLVPVLVEAAEVRLPLPESSGPPLSPRSDFAPKR